MWRPTPGGKSLQYGSSQTVRMKGKLKETTFTDVSEEYTPVNGECDFGASTVLDIDNLPPGTREDFIERAKAVCIGRMGFSKRSKTIWNDPDHVFLFFERKEDAALIKLFLQ